MGEDCVRMFNVQKLIPEAQIRLGWCHVALFQSSSSRQDGVNLQRVYTSTRMGVALFCFKYLYDLQHRGARRLSIL